MNQQDEFAELIMRLGEIRQGMVDLEATALQPFLPFHPDYDESARNLVHYMALRRTDLRPLQHRLASLGLSSLGRTESSVLPSIDRVLGVLNCLSGKLSGHVDINKRGLRIGDGQGILDRHTNALLGPPPSHRRVRIMVTMPTEAACSPLLVQQLLENGMDCMRINCAHDDERVWGLMIENLRKAEKAVGRRCRILMDLAGPKVRTGPVEPGPKVLKWRPKRDCSGIPVEPARVLFYPAGSLPPPATSNETCVPVSPEWLNQVGNGTRIRFRDLRGSQRTLTVTECGDDWRMAEGLQTAYVGPGTLLKALVPDRRISDVCRNEDYQGNSPVAVATEVGDFPGRPQTLFLREGDPIVLTRASIPGRAAQVDAAGNLEAPARIGCTLDTVFKDVKVGHRVWFDDGKIGGIVEATGEEEIRIRIDRIRPKGEKLKSDKGINFPDTRLRTPALTKKDLADLPFVAKHADIVGYSFVRTVEDVMELERQLELAGGRETGIVLKIETRESFERLPSLLLASMRTPCDGVMIARGDLAIECGFERLAEVQEQILWICEAAHVPVIWATQVLENVARAGLPSRAEVSDAAHGQRAECVMLNKGEHIVRAVKTLDDILQRMQAHQNKKRNMLRPLEIARRFSSETAKPLGNPTAN